MEELKAENVEKREMMDFIYSKVTARSTTQLCVDFDQYKAAGWNNILDVAKASVKFDSKSRAS